MADDYKTVDEYVVQFSSDVQEILNKIRQTVLKTVPEAKEAISYKIPAFKVNGKDLVYFGAWKTHIGFYALPSGTEAFKEELAKYRTGKGSAQFPLDQPIPYDLIRQIVKFRLEEVLAKS